MVNEKFAAMFFHGRDPLGGQVRIGICATDHRVRTGPAVDGVIAAEAIDGVVVGTPDQRIVSGSPVNGLPAGAA